MKNQPYNSVLPALLCLALTCPVFGQTVTRWVNNGTAWNTAANWSAGAPGPSDTASFNPQFGGTGVVNQVPTISTPELVQGLVLNNSYFGGGYRILNGALGSLQVGAGGIVVRGVGVHSISGLPMTGSSPGNLTISVGSSSTLRLMNGTTVGANSAGVSALSGTIIADNSGSTSPILTSANVVTLTGGGEFHLIGNAGGTTLNLGNLPAGSNTIGGVNVFRITPNGAATEINFANSAAGFTTRPGTRAAYHFIATSGNLGDATGARVTFVGSPFLGANGLLANSSGGGTVGYAIVTDAGGTDFATWNASNGIVRATPTATVTDAIGLAGLTATSRGQFNPAASTTITASGVVTTGSLRITPAGAGSILAMGSNNLSTNALMLDGSNDFTISGSGNLGGTGTRYIYVNDANTTLSTSIVIANGSNPTFIGGPGFVSLTSNVSQNTLSGTNRLILGGGVLRANNAQINFTTATASIISFTGGVLEITNGGNGTGSSADFRRSLGASGGNVTWGAGTSNEQGGGGFSAFGSAASVNIGGAATPATLTWNQTDFIADGFALRFGSTKSNAVLNWLNPLDLGSPTAYIPREIHVTKGAGGDRTVLNGVISGGGNADLFKTGTGILELNQANTYAGNTLVHEGTLLITNTTGSATGSGDVFVGSAGTLGGTGTVIGDTTILGTHAPGLSPGIINHDGNLTYLAGSNVMWELIANTSCFSVYPPFPVGPRGTDYDGINVTGFLDFSGLTNLNLFFDTSGSTVNWTDALWSTTQHWLLYDMTVANNFANLSNLQINNINWLDSASQQFNSVLPLSSFDIVNLNGDIYLRYQIIPEPSRALLAGLGLLGLLLRRRRA